MERAEKCSCGNVASVGFGQDKSCKILEYKWCVSCAECGKRTDFYKTKSEATCKGKGFLNDAEMTRWKNATDLQKAKKNFLKEQKNKNAEQRKY